MAFKQRYAALALVILVMVYGAYEFWLARGPHSISQTLGVVVGGVIVTVIISIVLAIPVAIVAHFKGSRDETDERDRAIVQKGTRNAYRVMTSMIWAVPVVALTSSAVLTANLVLLIFGAAEIFNYGSRLYYYHWGA